MINFLTGMVTGGAIVLIILCAFAVNHDKPKPASTVTTATGIDFWRALLIDLRGAVKPSAYSALVNSAMCTGRLNGDTLTIQVKDDFSYKMIVNVKVFEALEKVASAKAGRPITVVLLHNGEVDDG